MLKLHSINQQIERITIKSSLRWFGGVSNDKLHIIWLNHKLQPLLVYYLQHIRQTYFHFVVTASYCSRYSEISTKPHRQSKCFTLFITCSPLKHKFAWVPDFHRLTPDGPSSWLLGSFHPRTRCLSRIDALTTVQNVAKLLRNSIFFADVHSTPPFII